MRSHAPVRETVIWLGIRITSSAFRGLAPKHRSFIENYASNLGELNQSAVRHLKPILHRGEVIGYGVALYELVPHDAPLEFSGLGDFTRVYAEANTAWWNVVHHIKNPPEPNLFIQAG